jgi:hypothetical protein
MNMHDERKIIKAFKIFLVNAALEEEMEGEPND